MAGIKAEISRIPSPPQRPFPIQFQEKCVSLPVRAVYSGNQTESVSKPSTFIHFPFALRSEQSACLHSLFLQEQIDPFCWKLACATFFFSASDPDPKTKQRWCPPGITPSMSSFGQTQRLLAVPCKHSSLFLSPTPSCFWWFLKKFIMKNEDRKYFSTAWG